MEERTKITRSWNATVGYGIGAVVVVGILIVLFIKIAEGRFKFRLAVLVGVGIVLLFLATLFLLVMSLNANAANCPACGKRLNGLSAKSNDGILCHNCRTYVEGSDGMIWRTDENRVAEKPMFCSPLPEEPVFPNQCCVCGGASTHLEKISRLLGTARSPNPSNRWVSVDVPHCADHEGGAQVAGDQEDPYIKFRSYPYLRAFCQMNRTVPGHYRP